MLEHNLTSSLLNVDTYAACGLFGLDEIGPMPGLPPLRLLRVFYAPERTQTVISYAGYHQLCRLMLIYSFDIIRSIMLLL